MTDRLPRPAPRAVRSGEVPVPIVADLVVGVQSVIHHIGEGASIKIVDANADVSGARNASRRMEAIG